MKIAIASDHAGFEVKQALKPVLAELGQEVVDLGTDSTASVDYPDYAHLVGKMVAAGAADRGVLVCGSGTGMAIAANKVHGVRAAVAWDDESARLSRAHNNANVLSLGSRTTTMPELIEILKIWLATDFEGGRHARRVEKIEAV